MDLDIILKLMNCFAGSTVNQFGEFIAHDKYVKKQAIKEFTQKIMERLKEYEGTYVDVDIVRGIIKEEGVIWCRK